MFFNQEYRIVYTEPKCLTEQQMRDFYGKLAAGDVELGSCGMVSNRMFRSIVVGQYKITYYTPMYLGPDYVWSVSVKTGEATFYAKLGLLKSSKENTKYFCYQNMFEAAYSKLNGLPYTDPFGKEVQSALHENVRS